MRVADIFRTKNADVLTVYPENTIAQVPELLVDRVLTRDPIACTMEDDPKNVLRIMNEKGFRHMPVVEHGTLKGMLSIKSVLKFMPDEATHHDKSAVWEQIDFDMRRVDAGRRALRCRP